MDLSRITPVPLGSITIPQRITPQPDQQAGLLGAQAQERAAQTEVQTGLTEGQTGTNLAAFGAQQLAAGEEMLKPFVKLAQAREIMKANDIAITAALDLRGKVQSFQSSGTPHEQWVPQMDEEYKKVAQDALAKARLISPAAEEHVQRELLQERLTIFNSTQKKVIAKEIDTQQATLERVDQYVRQSYFQTTDPGERARLRETAIQAYRLGAATDVVGGQTAETKIADLNKYLEHNTVVELATTKGLTVGFEYADKNLILSPDEKRKAKNDAENALESGLKMAEYIEKKKEKELKLAQEKTAFDIMYTVTDPNTPITDIQKTLAILPSLVQSRGVGEEHARMVLKQGHDIITERTKLVPPKDDPETVSHYTYRIAFAPGTVTPEEIFNDPRIPESRNTLLKELNASRDAKHYRNNAVFKNLVAEIHDVVPPNSIINIDNITGSTIGTDIRRAITLFDQAIGDAATQLNKGGYLPDGEILRLGTPLKDQLVKQLREKKIPSLGRDFDTLQNLR